MQKREPQAAEGFRKEVLFDADAWKNPGAKTGLIGLATLPRPKSAANWPFLGAKIPAKGGGQTQTA